LQRRFAFSETLLSPYTTFFPHELLLSMQIRFKIKCITWGEKSMEWRVLYLSQTLTTSD
jgi:hypothetical protein